MWMKRVEEGGGKMSSRDVGRFLQDFHLSNGVCMNLIDNCYLHCNDCDLAVESIDYDKAFKYVAADLLSKVS